MNFVARKLSGAIGLMELMVVRGLHLENRYPPLFIVGAPRSGTTVIIQHIINRLRMGYFPNVARRHHDAPVTFTYFASRRHRFEPSYDSDHGLIDGPMAPSDGWEVFHRWFPRYDYRQAVREDRLHELRTIVALLERIFAAPIANKNNSNSVRIPYLEATFPDALFIHVTRDVTDTVSSILRSREKHSTPDDEWWGAPPPHYLSAPFGSVLERVVCQVWDLRREVEASLEKVDDGRRLTHSYETFCEHPSRVLDWVVSAYRERGITLEERGSAAAPAGIRRTPRPPRDHALAHDVAGIIERLEAAQ